MVLKELTFHLVAGDQGVEPGGYGVYGRHDTGPFGGVGAAVQPEGRSMVYGWCLRPELQKEEWPVLARMTYGFDGEPFRVGVGG